MTLLVNQAPGDDALMDALRDRISGTKGWLRQIGPDHVALYVPGNENLLVAFDMADAARGRSPAGCWHDALVGKRGYSTLTIIAGARSWFRDPALTHLFDELTDEEFFDDFETVTFAGSGAGGYAACAYSVAAPGATVFAVRPIATLERASVPWEQRFRSAWALDWANRYGYAPEMVEAAKQVYIITDPYEPGDAAHASLFRGRHITHLRANHAGSRVWQQLGSIGILDRLVAGAMSGTLGEKRFAQLWRGRRRDRDWLSGLMRKLDRMNRPYLQGVFARYVTRRLDNTAARRRLVAAQATLREAGRALPGDTDAPRRAVG